MSNEDLVIKKQAFENAGVSLSNWFQVSIALPLPKAEIVSSQLFDLGCSGVQEEDLDEGAGVRLIAYFEAKKDRKSLENQIVDVFVSSGIVSECQIENIPDTDWTTSWRSFFKPVFPTSRMAICPPWDIVPDPPGGFVITIDPQMAFGTGHHETTRLALLGLEKVINPGDQVLDVGTGSGILSIAAAKMGAAQVTGIDLEEPAIENAQLNCVANGVMDRIVLAQDSVERVSGVFDVVVANIISSILLPMVPALSKRMQTDGQIVLGGILDREHGALCKAIEKSGLIVDEMLNDGEWLCAVAHKS